MKIFGIGTDIVNINRLDKSLKIYGKAFKKRVFSVKEINYSEKKNNTSLNNQSSATVYFEANPIEKVVETLESKGIIFNGEIEVYPYGKLVLCSVPDNNSLGLYEPPVQ